LEGKSPWLREDQGDRSAIAMRLAKRKVQMLAINYQATREQAEKLSKLIDRWAWQTNLTDLALMIDQMEKRNMQKKYQS